MLSLYRRHRRACPHRSQGRKYRRCQCPIWVDGFLGGQEIRKSLGLRDWQRAQDNVREWEAENRQTVEQAQPVRIAEAAGKFLADAEARKLKEPTVYKYRLLFGRLETFAEKLGLTLLAELITDVLTTFRAEWTDGPRTAQKNLERLRAFFGFCQGCGWIATNPARKLKPPRVSDRPTLPFTRDEMLKILAALDSYEKRAGAAKAQQLRAFILLQRYSGMRIGDVVKCSTDRLAGNRLFLYTQKTGVAVSVVLPDFVVQALEAAPRGSERHWFWSGESKLHSAVGSWQRSLQTLFRVAGITDGHAHRFRDTFAVEFLLSNGSIEELSVLLGHRSVRVTERHYAPWVRARQEQLEEHLRRAWAQDPIVLLETKGTREVHGERQRAN